MTQPPNRDAMQPGGNLERFILDVVARSPQAKLLRRGMTAKKFGFDVRVVGVIGSTAVVFLSQGIGADDAGVSVSHPSTGHFGVTWTRPFNSPNYAVIGSAFTGASGIEHWAIDNGHTFDATQFGFVTVDNASFADLSSFFLAIGPP